MWSFTRASSGLHTLAERKLIQKLPFLLIQIVKTQSKNYDLFFFFFLYNGKSRFYTYSMKYVIIRHARYAVGT